MAEWNRKRILGWVTTVISVGIAVAIDQAYFRYNAYLLPVVGLVAVLASIWLILTYPPVAARIESFHHGFGVAKPLKYLLTAASVGAVTIFLVGGVEWYAIHKSQQHVLELRKSDAPYSSYSSSMPSLRPEPQSYPPASPEKQETQKMTRKFIDPPGKAKKEPSVVSKSAETLIAAAQPPVWAPVIQSAPGGINIGPGARVQSPTVNNFATPLPRLEWTTSHVDPVFAGNEDTKDYPSNKNPGVSIQITVAGRFIAPMFGIRCDRACFATEIGVGVAFIPRMYTTNQPDLAIAGFGGMPGQIERGSVVNVIIRSGDVSDVKILEVFPYVPPQ